MLRRGTYGNVFQSGAVVVSFNESLCIVKYTIVEEEKCQLEVSLQDSSNKFPEYSKRFCRGRAPSQVGSVASPTASRNSSVQQPKEKSAAHAIIFKNGVQNVRYDV